jgi:hypothetical protein
LIAVNSNVDIPLVAVSDSCGYSILETSGANLLWSTGETASSIIVLNAGTYTVTQSLNGCSSSPASGLASPLVLPQTPVITVADGCGSSILSASGNGLVWSTGETTSSIIVTVAGTYTVTATSGVCTSIPGSGIAAPIVIPEPPIITVSNNCGNSVLSTTGTGLNWSTGATTPSITVTNSGTYTVTQTSSGCTSSAASGFADPLLIPTVTLSPLSDVCINTPAFELSGGSPLGGVYSGTGVSNNTFDPSVAGLGDFTISYTYTDGNGCSASDQQVISVGCANTDELASSLVQVYPNPGNGTVYVISPQIVLDRIDVYDAHGKRVFNTCEQIENDGFVLYFNSLADGVYTIEFSGEEYFHRVRYILNE